MRTYRGLLGTVMLVAVLGGDRAAAAPPAPCNLLFTVELTPDVPNPRDSEFLSSLLSNHVRYQLTLREQRSDSVVLLELTGPGPDYRCQNVVETMRRDGRVQSVHVQPQP